MLCVTFEGTIHQMTTKEYSASLGYYTASEIGIPRRLLNTWVRAKKLKTLTIDDVTYYDQKVASQLNTESVGVLERLGAIERKITALLRALGIEGIQ